MQRGTGNSYLPTGNYVSGGSLGQSDLIPINVTPSHGTITPYGQGSEQRTSQLINLSLSGQVSLNLENGPSAALTSSNSPSVGSIIGLNAPYTVVTDGYGQDLGSTSTGKNSLQNQLCSCGRIRNVPEEVFEDVPEEASENVPEGGSENVPEEASENVPEEASENAPHGEIALYSNRVEYCNCEETLRISISSRSMDLPEFVTPFVNTILPNVATVGINPARTMTYAAHSSTINYVSATPRPIVMLPTIPRNPFSHWVPAGLLRNVLAPMFSSAAPRFLWNRTYGSISVQVPSMYPVNGTIGNEVVPHQRSLPLVPTYNNLVWGAEITITRENMVNINFAVQQPSFPMNHTPRFLGVNHGPGLMPRHPYNFHMAQNPVPQTIFVDAENMNFEGMLAIQQQVNHARAGLSMEVIVARMPCINFQSSGGSAYNNTRCCICMDDFADGEHIGSADCRHSFHFDCICQWLMENNSCPLCKRIALTV